MIPILIAEATLKKLRDKHNVSKREIEQCFENLCGTYLEDTREDNRTDPPTLAFIAPTNEDRLLKICFMLIDGNIRIKTAFEPDQQAIAHYEKFGK